MRLRSLGSSRRFRLPGVCRADRRLPALATARNPMATRLAQPHRPIAHRLVGDDRFWPAHARSAIAPGFDCPGRCRRLAHDQHNARGSSPHAPKRHDYRLRNHQRLARLRPPHPCRLARTNLATGLFRPGSPDMARPDLGTDSHRTHRHSFLFAPSLMADQFGSVARWHGPCLRCLDRRGTPRSLAADWHGTARRRAAWCNFYPPRRNAPDRGPAWVYRRDDLVRNGNIFRFARVPLRQSAGRSKAGRITSPRDGRRDSARRVRRAGLP